MNWIFQTRDFKNQVEMDRGKGAQTPRSNKKLSLSNLTALITFDEFKKMGEKDTKREQEALNQAALVQCQIGKNMEDCTKKD